MNLRIGYAPAVVVPRLVSLALVALLTRWLSPAEFGLYAWILVVGEFLDAVIFNWARLGVLRFGHKVTETASIRDGLFLLTMGLGVASVCCLVIAVSTAETTSLSFFLLLLVYVGGNALTRFALNVLRTQSKRKTYVVCELARSMGGLAIAFLVGKVLSPDFLSIAVSVFGFSAIVGGLIFFKVTRNLWGQFHPSVHFREMVSYALPLVVVFFLANGAVAMDRFFVNYLLGPAALGVYAAAFALAKPVFETLFNILNLDAFPRIVKAYETAGEEAAEKEMRSMLVSMLWLGVPGLAGLMLVADRVVAIALGSEFQEDAGWIVRAVAFSTFCLGLKSFFFDQVFHLKKESKLQAVALVPGVAVVAVLQMLLIPRFGVPGAAVACMFGAPVSLGASAFMSRRRLAVALPWREIFLIFASTVLMVAVVSGVLAQGHTPILLGLAVGLGGISYLAASVLFGIAGGKSAERLIAKFAK